MSFLEANSAVYKVGAKVVDSVRLAMKDKAISGSLIRSSGIGAAIGAGAGAGIGGYMGSRSYDGSMAGGAIKGALMGGMLGGSAGLSRAMMGPGFAKARSYAAVLPDAAQMDWMNHSAFTKEAKTAMHSVADKVRSKASNLRGASNGMESYMDEW